MCVFFPDVVWNVANTRRNHVWIPSQIVPEYPSAIVRLSSLCGESDIWYLPNLPIILCILESHTQEKVFLLHRMCHMIHMGSSESTLTPKLILSQHFPHQRPNIWRYTIVRHIQISISSLSMHLILIFIVKHTIILQVPMIVPKSVRRHGRLRAPHWSHGTRWTSRARSALAWFTKRIPSFMVYVYIYISPSLNRISIVFLGFKIQLI